MPPTFSCIIPTYQGLTYLDRTVQSVRDQTDPDWECWVIDDASPDATGDLVDAWARKDSRIHALHQPTNRGGYVARNRAIAESQGLWIKPLDQDDRLHPDAFARLRAASQNHPEAVAISVTAQSIDAQDRVIGSYPWVTDDLVWSSLPFVTANLLGFTPTWVPSCHAYRRTAWEAVGGYRHPDPQVRDRGWGTDLELLWRIGLQGPVITLAAFGVDYRTHPQQVSQQNLGQAEVFMRAQLLHAFLQESPTIPAFVATLAWGRHWTASLLIAAHAWQSGDEALALYTLDQLRTFPGPSSWEEGALMADLERWMDAIRRHRWGLDASAVQSHTLRVLLQTGMAINPATVSALRAHPDWPVYGMPAPLAGLAAVWPTLNLRVVSEAQLRAKQPATMTGVVIPPPTVPGPVWVADHLECTGLWPLVV